MSLAIDALSTVKKAFAVGSYSFTHTSVGTPTGAALRSAGVDVTAATSVTYGGNAMTLEINAATGFEGSDIWRLASPPSGAQTVNVIFSGNQAAQAQAITVTGGDTATVFSNHSSSTGNSSSMSTGACVSAVGEIVIAIGETSNGPTTIGGTGSEDFNSTQFGQNGVGAQAPGAASVTITYSSAGGNWSMCAASFKAGAAAAGRGKFLTLLGVS